MDDGRGVDPPRHPPHHKVGCKAFCKKYVKDKIGGRTAVRKVVGVWHDRAKILVKAKIQKAKQTKCRFQGGTRYAGNTHPEYVNIGDPTNKSINLVLLLEI